MAVVRRRTSASPEAVFAVLADGWRYADWVLGAQRIRAVDEDWPQPGSRFHHRVGAGPVKVEDSSQVEALDPGRGISVRVKVRPIGTARVRIVLVPQDDGGTEILFEEHPLEGPLRQRFVRAVDAVLWVRNVESLRRLARIAEKGVRQPA
jgi:uncharacterized protein YndB with AHSA1/START domain